MLYLVDATQWRHKRLPLPVIANMDGTPSDQINLVAINKVCLSPVSTRSPVDFSLSAHSLLSCISCVIPPHFILLNSHKGRRCAPQVGDSGND